jgi:hypothetical protein
MDAMRRAIDYLTEEEIRALRRAAASLARDVKYRKRGELLRKQIGRTTAVKRTARV